MPAAKSIHVHSVCRQETVIVVNTLETPVLLGLRINIYQLIAAMTVQLAHQHVQYLKFGQIPQSRAIAQDRTHL